MLQAAWEPEDRYDVRLLWQSAKLAVIAEAVCPSAVAWGMELANSLLPKAGDASGDRARSGWQSLSSWAPSRLTRLTEQAALENNQM